MSAALIILYEQERLIKRLRQAGAYDEHSAVSLESIGCRSSFILRRLVRQAVIRAAAKGEYFLCEQALECFRQQQRKATAIGWVLFFLIIAVALLLGALSR
jgi:hypothetical protein